MSTKSQIANRFGNTSSYFFEKRKFANKMTVENSEENIISGGFLVSKELNNVFQNAARTLNVNENLYIIDSSSSVTHPEDKGVNICKSHPGIFLLKQKLENVDYFSFKKHLGWGERQSLPVFPL